jgi:hypothetical protein
MDDFAVSSRKNDDSLSIFSETTVNSDIAAEIVQKAYFDECQSVVNSRNVERIQVVNITVDNLQSMNVFGDQNGAKTLKNLFSYFIICFILENSIPLINRSDLINNFLHTYDTNSVNDKSQSRLKVMRNRNKIINYALIFVVVASILINAGVLTYRKLKTNSDNEVDSNSVT